MRIFIQSPMKLNIISSEHKSLIGLKHNFFYIQSPNEIETS